ncbi:MAG: tRNA uridine-5-carboxymethylaminomethyl(34) synthesis GTPase MnmE [Clostridia bacterium]
MNNETIVALATARGKSAISIIRLSGEQAKSIAATIFSPMPSKPNFIKKGTLSTELFKDEAMCVYFNKPKSYTGEDCVEIYMHGGRAISDGTLKECIKKGARIATNGEFSKRAFLNGKMTLENAEGVIEMIEAESALQVKSGYDMLTGRLQKEIEILQNELTDLLAQIEVSLDYPEEDLEVMTLEKTQQPLEVIKSQIEKLLSSALLAPIVKNGADIAIVGEVNAGKSSILNALVNMDRAIVSTQAGTTRDIVSATINYKDLKLNFYDTAGLRETESEIEMEGISRAKNLAANCDLVLYVVQTPLNDGDKQFLNALVAPHIAVLNKCDIVNYSDSDKEYGFALSALKNIGIEELKEKIYQMFISGKADSDQLIVISSRHIDCLKRSYDALNNAFNVIKTGTLDCIAVPLYDAWNAMGEISGKTATEEIVNTIFSKFCLGK